MREERDLPTRAHHALLPPPPQLTLLLVLEDRLHRQLTYDLLPSRPRGGGGGCGGTPGGGGGGQAALRVSLPGLLRHSRQCPRPGRRAGALRLRPRGEVCGPGAASLGGRQGGPRPSVPHASLPSCRTIGRSWPPSWTAPSSSTVELSHDLDPYTSGCQAPWKPTSWLPGEAWHWPLQLGGEPGSLSACVPASENLPSHSSRSPWVGLRVAGSGPPGVREPVLGDWLAAACP